MNTAEKPSCTSEPTHWNLCVSVLDKVRADVARWLSPRSAAASNASGPSTRMSLNQAVHRIGGHAPCALVLAAGLALAGSAAAALHDRGDGLLYDDLLDVTWLQDAGTGGRRSWSAAVGWAENFEYQGFDDWRLPSMSVSSGVPVGSAASVADCASAPESACRDNELGYMYYQILGGNGNDLTGDQGLIQNLQVSYWSGTEGEAQSDTAWEFFFTNGDQDFFSTRVVNYVWAVRPGDTSITAQVPEPSTLVLISAGLLLTWMRSGRRPVRLARSS